MAVQPLVTVSLPADSACSTLTLSFAVGQAGAFAGVYPDTALTEWGQIGNTWGEFNMVPDGVVDISRKVLARGEALSIEGPSCTADTATCVFKCVDPSAHTCGGAGSYRIANCSAATQPGASTSPDGTSGGCGWLGAATAKFTATFS